MRHYRINHACIATPPGTHAPSRSVVHTQLRCAARVHQQAFDACSPQTTDESLEAGAVRMRGKQVRAIGSVKLDMWQLYISHVCMEARWIQYTSIFFPQITQLQLKRLLLSVLPAHDSLFRVLWSPSVSSTSPPTLSITPLNLNHLSSQPIAQ
jgi:hypothetical protein